MIISLKSRHAPQTKRLTFTFADNPLTAGRTFSTSAATAAKDALSVLSPGYLQRHSLQTRSKDMPPARGTEFREVAVNARETATGVKAVEVVRRRLRTAEVARMLLGFGVLEGKEKRSSGTTSSSMII